MKKIYLIGDSHVLMHRSLEPEVICSHFGACTAYGLMNPDSRTGGLKTLQKFLEEHNPKEVMMIPAFGEIDCRVLIYMKHIQHNAPLDIMVNIVVDRYFWAIDLILENKFDVAIHIPIPAVWQTNEYKLPHYASEEIRGEISTMFTDALKYKCKKRGIAFYDPWILLSPNNGVVNRGHLLPDLVHIDPTRVPIAEDFKKWLVRMSLIS